LIKHFELNTKGRDLIVGDIHGCFDLLSVKLREINFDTLSDRLFSVGDLVDRGEKSEECIAWINKSWFHPVRGNHEQMAIDVVAGEYDTYNYIRNGGAWLLGLTENEQQNFAAMFDNLPIAIDVMTKSGLVGIVHAECPVDDWLKLDKELYGERKDLFKDACLWDRFRSEHKIETMIDNVYQVVVGHTPVNEPALLGNVMYIDTGAVFCGNLTIVEI
jgi:serine/threonine protein phosphatase 1